MFEDLRHFIRSSDRFLVVRSVHMTAPRFVFGGEVASPNLACIGLRVEGCLTAIVDEKRRGAREHIVRAEARWFAGETRIATARGRLAQAPAEHLGRPLSHLWPERDARGIKNLTTG